MASTVDWVKCGDDGHWCSFENLELNKSLDHKGVYVIWHEGSVLYPSRTVRVGQGNIKDRITAHRGDSDITQYAQKGTLRVTWVIISDVSLRLGIERYLFDTLNPLVGERAGTDDVEPVVVNLP